MQDNDANCCVCEGWFAPAEGRPCARCPDDWLCSAACLARHRRTATHRESMRAWARYVAGGGDGDGDGDGDGGGAWNDALWRATVEVNRGLRRRLAEAEAALHVARAEVHVLRRAGGGRSPG